MVACFFPRNDRIDVICKTGLLCKNGTCIKFTPCRFRQGESYVSLQHLCPIGGQLEGRVHQFPTTLFLVAEGAALGRQIALFGTLAIADELFKHFLGQQGLFIWLGQSYHFSPII